GLQLERTRIESRERRRRVLQSEPRLSKRAPVQGRQGLGETERGTAQRTPIDAQRARVQVPGRDGTSVPEVHGDLAGPVERGRGEAEGRSPVVRSQDESRVEG